MLSTAGKNKDEVISSIFLWPLPMNIPVLADQPKLTFIISVQTLDAF